MSTHLDETQRMAMSEAVSSEAAAPRRRLLCATDLTARSEHAMRRAGLLARQMDADAHFVHAVDDGPSGRVLRMKVNRAFARLLSESERATSRAPKETTVAVRLGKPLEAIAAAARDYDPHLIVMAKPRRRYLDPVIGTTAERVIRRTGRAVLVVDGTADRTYERVLLATDVAPTESHVACSILEMGILHDARAWVVRARSLEAIRRAMDHVNPDLLVVGVSRWLAFERVLAGSVADQVFRNVNRDVLAVFPTPPT